MVGFFCLFFCFFLFLFFSIKKNIHNFDVHSVEIHIL